MAKTSKPDLRMTNHKYNVLGYWKEGLEKRSQREQELLDGAPLNQSEKRAEMQADIDRMEKKLGFDDESTRAQEPTVIAGTTARNALQGPTIRPVNNGGFEAV